MTQLKRTLGLGACVFYGVGSILGAGIYTLIGKTAGIAGNTTWLAYLGASICAVLTAFAYAELCTAYPKTGGEYVYAKEAFGKKTGTVLGFIITLNGIITGAAVAVGFAGYFSDLTGIEWRIVPLLVVGFIFLVNAAGVMHSSVVNIVFTIIEVGGLVLVIACGVPSFGNVSFTELPPDGATGIFTAAALAFFAFVGFEEIVKLAEETRNPQKIIPRALMITSIIVIVVYLLVSLSAVSAVPFEQLGKSESPLADVVESQIGQTGVLIISVIALFSTSNTLLSNMLGSSRVLLNIARETPRLSLFAKISGKRKTPIVGLILILVLMCSFVLIRDIETIARIATVFIFLTFLAVNLCLIALRVRKKNWKAAYRVPVNIRNVPVFSVLGAVLTIFLLGFTVYSLVTGQAAE